MGIFDFLTVLLVVIVIILFILASYAFLTRENRP